MPYEFICSGSPRHLSYSASIEQVESSCPTCGAPTHPREKGRIEPDHKLNKRELYELSQDLKRRGYSEKDTAHYLRLTVTDLRLLIHQARMEQGAETRSKINELKDEGNTPLKIAKVLGLNESSVRAMLDSNREQRNV